VFDAKGKQILATINHRKIFVYIIKNLDLQDSHIMNQPWKDLNSLVIRRQA